VVECPKKEKEGLNGVIVILRRGGLTEKVEI